MNGKKNKIKNYDLSQTNKERTKNNLKDERKTEGKKDWMEKIKRKE